MNRRSFLKSLGVITAGLLFVPTQVFSSIKPKGRTFFVAKHGKDFNSGTPDKPLATISEALNRIDERAPQSENIIILLPDVPGQKISCGIGHTHFISLAFPSH